MQRLTTSPDGHFIQYADGSPFFYLADTVWMLFGKLTEPEARKLFADRATKGFTVIQAVVFRDLFVPNTPNVAGVRPFVDEQALLAARMNPAWTDRVALITGVAAEYGLVIGLLPTWGDKWTSHSNSAGPVIYNQETAHRYGRFLSDALGECGNVIWLMGGDSPIRTREHVETVRAMAAGIRAGASGDRLMSFHPTGGASSAAFHSEDWLDIHGLQSGHGHLNSPNYRVIEALYENSPPKPVMDVEANYEWMPVGIGRQNGIRSDRRAFFSAYDVRRSYYRSVLAGAAGFTYGCEPIRQVYRAGDRCHAWDGDGIKTWEQGLDALGSSQLDLLKQALLERDYFTRIPAQDALIGACGRDNEDPVAHISVARCAEGHYLMVYVPVRRHLHLDTSLVSSSRLAVSVYNPDTCALTASWLMDNAGHLEYIPACEPDTFMIIEGAAIPGH